MQQKIHSPKGLKAAGVGPKIFKPVFLILVAGVLIQIFFPSVSSIPFHEGFKLDQAGWIWIGFGMIIYITGIIQFLKGFPKGVLITKGVYGLSRNPIYSSWIIFILPGLAMVADNWIFLISSLVMYLAFTSHISTEEKELEEIFGQQYLKYKERVHRVLFFPVLK